MNELIGIVVEDDETKNGCYVTLSIVSLYLKTYLLRQRQRKIKISTHGNRNRKNRPEKSFLAVIHFRLFGRSASTQRTLHFVIIVSLPNKTTHTYIVINNWANTNEKKKNL